MLNYTYELSKEHTYPHISVYKRLRDGIQVGWRINTDFGYELPHQKMEIDPETGEDIVVTVYRSEMYLPLKYNWKAFSLVAVPRSEVGEEEF